MSTALAAKERARNRGPRVADNGAGARRERVQPDLNPRGQHPLAAVEEARAEELAARGGRAAVLRLVRPGPARLEVARGPKAAAPVRPLVDEALRQHLGPRQVATGSPPRVAGEAAGIRGPVAARLLVPARREARRLGAELVQRDANLCWHYLLTHHQFTKIDSCSAVSKRL